MKYDWNEIKEKPRQDKYYDICMLDIGEKIMPGWWNGTSWDGLNYEGQEVKRWKYTAGYNE